MSFFWFDLVQSEFSHIETNTLPLYTPTSYFRALRVCCEALLYV